MTANQFNTDQPTERIPVSGERADAEQQRLSLSVTQVLASTAAAVTAALIGSRLGVAGTLIGAALASVITVVGSAVFGHSILMTRKQVRRAVLQVRGPEQRTHPSAAAHHPADDRTVLIPAVTRFDLERAAQSGSGLARSGPGRPRPTRRRRVGAAVLMGVAAAAVIFVSSLGAVTLVETIKGSPLSGGDSGGLSVLGGNGSGTIDTGQVPATTTPDVTGVSTVTHTVTSPPTRSTPATSKTSAVTSAPTTSAPSTQSSTAPTSAQSAGTANGTAPATPAPSSPAGVGTVGG